MTRRERGEELLRSATIECEQASVVLVAARRRRAALLAQYKGVLTRHRAKEITGLSVGRIQQLIEKRVQDS